jgi:hypothetical protein
MKKLLVSMFAILGLGFPMLAQVDHDFKLDEKIPVASLDLKKNQIPPEIIKSVTSDFENGQPLTFGKFPFVLEKYAWIIKNDDADLKPDQYQVFIKAKDGSDIYAIYTPEGKIIQSRAIYKNIEVPLPVRESLAKSQYKDWTIIGDKEILSYFIDKNNVEKHFRITVEKNNAKHSISFNYKEPATK